jgi:hypothetical protein
LQESGPQHSEHCQRIDQIESGEPLDLAAGQARAQQKMLPENCDRQREDGHEVEIADENFGVHECMTHTLPNRGSARKSSA